jgi:hypothetical protein
MPIADSRRGDGEDEEMMAGTLWTLLWLAMLGLGGWWAAGSGFRQPHGLVRAIGAGMLGWGWAVLGTLGLGLVGWLARGPLLVWAALGLAIAGASRMLAGEPARSREKAEQSAWDATATIALGLTLWAIVTIGVKAWVMPVKVATDAPIYHLYFAARWWKAGRIFLVPAPFGETVVTYFPANGELWFAALMTLAGGDLFAKIGQAPFLGLAVASIFGIARRLGAGVPAATVALAWFVTGMAVILYSFEANVDTIFAGCYLISVYFLLRYAMGDGGAGALALAALAAGGAWGTKSTGMVYIPPLILLGGVAVWARTSSWRVRFAHWAILGALPIVLAGYWYGRNAWLTGNPLYPLQVSAFGRVLLVGWHERSAMSQSQFYLQVNDISTFVDIILYLFDPRLAPFWIAGLAGTWAVGRPNRLRRRWVWGISALVVTEIAIVWILIPYRTQEYRFLLPALGLATVPLACLLERGRWLRGVAVGLLALHLLTPQTWPVTPLGASVPWGWSRQMRSAPQGILALFDAPARESDSGALMGGRFYQAALLTLGIASLATALAWSRAIRHRGAGRWTLAGISTAVLVGLPAFAIWEAVGPRVAFPSFPPYLRGWIHLDAFAGPAGARIAYAGTNRAYYLMGRGLRNDVMYVNIDAHRDWLLHDYHRAAIARGEPNWPDPRPGWDRLHPDYDAWLANLIAARVDFLFITRADPIDGRFNIADRENFPIERVWADAHPESFRLLYGAADGDPNVRIYRFTPPRRPS